MKKRLFLLALMVVAIVSIFAITASAMEFGNVTQVSGITTVDGLDKTSRVLMDDGITYPSAYIFKNLNDISFDALNTATGKAYTANSVVAIEFPEGCTEIKRTFAGATAIKYAYFPSTITGFQWGTFLSTPSLEEVEFSKDCTISAINTDAFASTGIKSLKLPNTVLTVNENFIRNCSKLETIIFGESFTQVFNRNAFLAGCGSIKTMYVPAGVFDENGDISMNCRFFGWNDRDNTTFVKGGVIYYTGTKAQAEKVISTQRALYQSAYSNANDYNKAVWWVINSVSLDEYNALTAEQKSAGCYFVYEYNKCDAFYDGEHDYKGTGLCLDGVNCDVCGKSVAGASEHSFVEGIEYANGYTQAGVYCKDCTNEGCTALDVTRAVDALFSALAENGYSSNGTGIAFGGYTVNIEALAEFNTVNKNNTLTYGVVIMNPKYVGDSFFTDGSANATKGFVVADMSASEYSNIKVMIDGLGANKSLELVIALYAYTDGADVEFIQSEDTNSACSSVEKTDATLYTVSLTSVVDKPNTGLDMLPPYNKENA